MAKNAERRTQNVLINLMASVFLILLLASYSSKAQTTPIDRVYIGCSPELIDSLESNQTYFVKSKNAYDGGGFADCNNGAGKSHLCAELNLGEHGEDNAMVINFDGCLVTACYSFEKCPSDPNTIGVYIFIVRYDVKGKIKKDVSHYGCDALDNYLSMGTAKYQNQKLNYFLDYLYNVLAYKFFQEEDASHYVQTGEHYYCGNGANPIKVTLIQGSCRSFCVKEESLSDGTIRKTMTPKACTNAFCCEVARSVCMDRSTGAINQTITVYKDGDGETCSANALSETVCPPINDIMTKQYKTDCVAACDVVERSEDPIVTVGCIFNHYLDGKPDVSRRSSQPPSSEKFAVSNGENYSTDAVSCYPNPAQDKISFVFANNIGKISEIKIMDVLGNILSNKTLSNSQQLSADFDISDLKSGVYYGLITSETNEFRVKFIVNK